MRLHARGWLAFPFVLALGCAAGDGPTRIDASADSGRPPDAGPTVRDAGMDASRPADAGADAGPSEVVGLCETCSIDAQCGVVARCAPLSDGQPVCLRLCVPEFNDCPRGFSCAGYAPLDFEHVCLPVGEVCCIDEDADGYGGGASCLGDDCDDDDATRHPDAPEICDLGDQDCDEAIDEMFVDCGAAGCEAGPGGTFDQIGAGGCADGACTDPVSTSCGDYSCDGGGEDGDVCASVCDGEGADDDRFCALVAHCDLGACLPDLTDGGVCDEDSDCASGSCENGFCCAPGLTCCNEDSDCPGYPGEGTVCEVPADCEGSRGQVQCNLTSFACETISGVPDDSACDAGVTADTCGPFADVLCTGAVDQPRPRCASSCSDDAACDATAHCDSGFCFPDLEDGSTCDEASDCTSGHCRNGFCCASGDCCRTAVDCPAGYGSPATCDDPRGCQGTRDAAVCEANRCGTEVDVDDDSACTSGIEADTCGLYPSLRCTGSVGQTTPSCATSCTGDSECDENAHCDDGGCVRDLPNGDACNEASDCASDHCGNGFCCAGGDCCATSTDCPSSYARPSECLAASTCQGSRRDAVCNLATNTCQLGDPIGDDSGCNGLLSNDCGLFPSVSCTSMPDQTTDQGSRCDMACSTSGECDFGAFCNGSGTCQSQGMAGDACTASNQCSGGLNCIDGVCCSGACSGTCEACNVAGHLGQCWPIPSDTDPAGECGGVDCSNYFVGWSGDVCRERTDAPASAVDCNGARACETAANVCPSQPAGPIRVTCDDTCQNPVSGTCSGTNAPSCQNVNPGTISCGDGECRRTVDRCINGADNACVAGTPATETCNDLDDDCDTVVDNNITGSAVNSYEPNDVCGEVAGLPQVDTDGSAMARTGAATGQVYYDGDTDYYRIYVRETGSDCVTTCVDNERARLDVTITVPSGAGSYRLCGVHNTCSNLSTTDRCVTVNGGATGSITITGDSHCCSGILCNSNNSENFYLRVTGVGAPRWECAAYRLDYYGGESCNAL